MRYLLILFLVLTVLTCGAILGYTMIVLTNPPRPQPELTTVNTVDLALADLGLEDTTWQTLVVTTHRDVPLSTNSLWNAWFDVTAWPEWQPGVTAAAWLSGEPWTAGAQFALERDYGALFGARSRVQVVGEVSPGITARWCDDADRVRSCQLWLFEPLPNGQTRATYTAVYTGAPVAALRPIVQRDWQRQADAAIDNLLLRAAANP